MREYMNGRAMYIGIDLGGTKIAGAAVNVETGAVSGRKVTATEAHRGPDAVLARIAGLAEEVRRAAGLEREEIGGVGLGGAGGADPQGGGALFLPHLPRA